MLKKKPILKLKDIELENLCSFLEWDSNFFSKNIASVKPNKINQSDLKNIFDWCDKNKIDCLYLLADPNCQITNYLAMKNYFSFVDIRLTLMVNDFNINLSSNHSSTRQRNYKIQLVYICRLLQVKTFRCENIKM